MAFSPFHGSQREALVDGTLASEAPGPAPGKITRSETRYRGYPSTARGQAPIQRRAAARPAATPGDAGDASADDPFGLHVDAAARLGTSGGGERLPFGDVIQRAFGRHDVAGIVAHADAPAAAGARAMGARAFATGNHVAFDGAPDLHTAAHEAAHVIQQRAGVWLKGGVGAVGDTYERHADAVADAVVAGRSAEALLDGFVGAGAGGGGVQRKAASAPARATTTGSATVVGAAADTEQAVDDSFTPTLVRALKKNRKLSVEEVLELVAGKALDHEGHVHHPTAVHYGEDAPGKRSSKTAVLIPNQHYTPLPSLSTPIAEAKQLEGVLDGRGWHVKMHADQTADKMASLWTGMVSTAKPGDELMAYYGGHGLPQGLAGVTISADKPDDVFTNAQVADVVDGATARGASIRFVMDSCHSGAAVQSVREERSNQLQKQAPTSRDAGALKTIEDLKRKLIAAVNERTTGLEACDQQIAAAKAEAEKASARDPKAKDTSTLDTYTALRADLDSLTRQVIDALWKEIVSKLDGTERLAPPPLTNYATAGEQLDYLDKVWNMTATGK